MNIQKKLLPLLCICSVIAVTYIVMHLPPHEKWCNNCWYEENVRIVSTDYPADTYTLDILVPEKKLGKYACEWSEKAFKESSDISPDCTLNRYAEDGYVSARLHDANTSLSWSKANPDGNMLKASIPHTYGRFSQHYFEQIGDYKIAYVDKTGKILGVTAPVKVQRTLDEQQQTVFSANGNEASCIMYSHRTYVAVTAAKVTAVHMLMILLIAILRNNARRKRTAKEDAGTAQQKGTT